MQNILSFCSVKGGLLGQTHNVELHSVDSKINGDEYGDVSGKGKNDDDMYDIYGVDCQ